MHVILFLSSIVEMVVGNYCFNYFHVVFINISINHFDSVELDDVCDGKLDCPDESDEMECDSIVTPGSYLKHVPPILNGEKYITNVKCFVQSIFCL